ncbi:hypothetical protein Snas_0680 [Stackebrandtia nassauensis DSM 44728]|uniref:Uncharacterized protein n=2 Tax=Stackebrandtia TaxID=283810 RepID=D3Q6Z4_STANL|nr:hypothetical protein Snas_0680 [Stackebrandtia nassauensis DSM 44728]
MKSKILGHVQEFEASMKRLVKSSTGMEGQGRTVEAFKQLVEGPVQKKSTDMNQTLEELKERLNTIGVNTEEGDAQDARVYQADYA